MFKFETLDVWKKSIKFCNEILIIADKLPQRYQYSIADQLKRAGISVPTNISEGSGRKNKKESNQFFNIAKGSCYEVVNLLIIMKERKMLDQTEFQKLYNDAEEICKMLTGLMRRVV